MRILIVAHSHGRRSSLEFLLNNEIYDRVIFLGDYCADFESIPIKHKFPPIVIKGQYDKYHNKPEFVRTRIGGFSFHIVNGYNLKSPLLDMKEYVKGRDIDVVVYCGAPYESVVREGKAIFVNPGYFGVEHHEKRTYAIITIEGDKMLAETKECYVD